MRYAMHFASLLLHLESKYECHPPTAAGTPAIIAFSGTQTLRDLLLDDMDIVPGSWKTAEGTTEGFVHGGFARRTQSLLAQMQDFVDEHDEFSLAGHSLGGACATLAAAHLAQRGKRVLSVHAFGTPGVATRRFQQYYRRLGLWDDTFLYATPLDPVVHSIPRIYKKVGVETPLAFDDSNATWAHHSMDAYMQGLRATPPRGLPGSSAPL